MKLKLITALGTTTSLVLAIIATNPFPSVAQGSAFVCSNWQGSPATVSRSADGAEVPVIIWKSADWGEEYTPQKRCEIVSQRFEEFSATGMLKYITTGSENNYPIICVAQSDQGGCAGLLFTLKIGTDANQTLAELMAVRNRAGGPLSETGCDSVYSNSGGNLYVDMDLYLECVTPESAAEEYSEPVESSPEEEPLF